MHRLALLGDAVLLDDPKYDAVPYPPLDFKPYGRVHDNQLRWGVELTEHPDDFINSLQSIEDYNDKNGTNYLDKDFTMKTAAAQHFPLCNQFEIGRTHVIKLEQGGYFPWHRDLDPSSFRLIQLLDTAPESFLWIMDDKLLQLQNGKTYFINALKPHCVFAMKPSTFLLMCCKITDENIKKVVKAASHRR